MSASPVPLSVEALQFQVGVLSFVGVIATLGVPGLVGPVVSITTAPLMPEVAVLLALSVALTRKYQVPSERFEGGAKIVALVVALPATLAKVELADHSSVYAGFFKPVPLSAEAVQLTVGVASAVGELTLGVPGVLGGVVSAIVVIDTSFEETVGKLPGAPYSTM